MGRASRWLRNLLGGKKPTEDPPEKKKKGWGFVKTFHKDRPPTPAVVSGDEQIMRVTAVADTTALLAAGGRPARMKTEKRAAVKIQSAFRGYLARRALRALKGLVKIQALVRGNIVRKQAAETLRCMKALVRAQTRARAFRALRSDTAPSKSSRSYPGPTTPENYESISSKWLEEEPSWNMREASKSTDNEKNAKILEVDSGKSLFYSRRRSSLGHLHSDRSPGSLTAGPDSLSKGSTTPTQLSTPSTSPFDRRQHKNPLQRFSAADSGESPRFCGSSQSGSSRRGPFTPAKSKYSTNSINGSSNHPSYMAKTESSAAKSRSQSAPRQRPECGKTASMRRLPAHELEDRALRYSTPNGKAYPGSGRLDRLGFPMGM